MHLVFLERLITSELIDSGDVVELQGRAMQAIRRTEATFP